MVFENGVKNIKAAAYNSARTVNRIASAPANSTTVFTLS